MMDKLIGGTADITGTISPGLYYVDIISFNIYPFQTETYWQTGHAGGTPITRADVVGYLRSTNRFADDLDHLASLINTAGRTGTLDVAVTEANISFEQDRSNRGVGDLGPGSFLAGQFWAEMLGVAMEKGVKFVSFWSTIEGTGGNTYLTDIGYLGTELSDSDPSPSNVKRSTYYHFEMIANHFKGEVATATYSASNFKVFASKHCTGPVVLLMNQETSSSITFDLRLDNTPFTPGSGAIAINIDADVPRKILNQTIGPKTTWLLVLEECGRVKKKIIYSEAINLAGDPPATPAISSSLGWVRCERCEKSGWLTFEECREDNNRPDTIEFSSNATIDTSAIFNSILRVKPGVTLTIDSAAIVFRPDTYVEVQPGGKLHIKDSWLKGCGGVAWSGILVRGGNDTIQQLIMRNTIVDDANEVVIARKAKFLIIEDNVFSTGRTAIKLDSCAGFFINRNDFSNFSKNIVTRYSTEEAAEIIKNYFSDANEAVKFNNDDHEKLTISCNFFENYRDYAVNSDSTLLTDQGDGSEGAGNKFVSTSTLLNNRFLHNGNYVIYYADPSDTFSLYMDSVHTADVSIALADGCQEEEEESLVQRRYINSDGANTVTTLSLVPNPSTGKITIKFPVSDAAAGQLIIRTLYGTVVREYKIVAGQDKLEADLGELGNGLYLASWLVTGQQPLSQKFVILH
jgi:hypothetical protein